MTVTHAFVVGAGIARLFTAGALSEKHDRVTIIDRDTWPPDGDCRGATEAARGPD
jgi:glycine/D-amino acid oxidase-like deaminating enzyme